MTTTTIFPRSRPWEGPNRVENLTPVLYRLVKRDGVLTLQGLFEWCEGSCGGHEWKDIPTINLDEEVNKGK